MTNADEVVTSDASAHYWHVHLWLSFDEVFVLALSFLGPTTERILLVLSLSVVSILFLYCAHLKNSPKRCDRLLDKPT